MRRGWSLLIKKLKAILIESIRAALSALNFPEMDFTLAPPKAEKFGDISTNIALLLSKDLSQPPLDIAEIIAETLKKEKLNHIDDITVSPPGFINFLIDASFYQNSIVTILEKNDQYGRGGTGKDKTANVEFVSANPTGPLTVGHGRNAVLGDTVANILEWHGFHVTREYYYNDAGQQMQILGESVSARYFELIEKGNEFPENGYQGKYIVEIARNISETLGNDISKNDPRFRTEAEKIIFEKIKTSLDKLGIYFDQFTKEKTFYETGAIEQLLEDLKSKDLIYEKDGATWLKATALGRKQDRVFIKSSGEPTYRLPDTAYHREKISRGFNLIVDIFGADHTDSYPDILAALAALDLKTDHIRVLLYQFVTLLRNGEKVKMSTRKGEFVTLDNLLTDTGSDVVRYFFIMRSMNSHLDFDLDLAKDQSENNPVYYLQYAHARICNIIKHGLTANYEFTKNFDSNLLTHNDELKLMRQLVHFPEVMETVLETLEPQGIANYLQELAAQFHKFYGKCRVITDNISLSRARLGLVSSVRIVLSSGLSILGISAPERM